VSVGADNEKIERGAAPSTVSTVGDSAVHVLVGVVVGQGGSMQEISRFRGRVPDALGLVRGGSLAGS